MNENPGLRGHLAARLQAGKLVSDLEKHLGADIGLLVDAAALALGHRRVVIPGL